MNQWMVICIGEAPHGYEIATRSVFNSRAAAERYAATLSATRCPIVVMGRFGQLRFDGDER